MQTSLICAALAIAVPIRDIPRGAEVRPMQEQLLGEWLLMNRTIGGREDFDDKVGGTAVFTRDTMQFLAKNADKAPDDIVSYTLDLSKNPAHVDFIPKREANLRILGILKLEGDVLTICLAFGGKGSRPVEFGSPRESQVALMQFRRIKK